MEDKLKLKPEQEIGAEEIFQRMDEEQKRLIALFKEFRDASWEAGSTSEKGSLCQTICYCLYHMIERLGPSDAYFELFSQSFSHSMSLTN
jgi:hypothetical protein